MSQEPAIAEVVLTRPVGKQHNTHLSYRVPPPLRSILRPGHLVWVPLRHQQVQGVVVGISEHVEGVAEEKLRDIVGLVDAEAAIPAVGLRLARQVAASYHAPLFAVLALFLPPGVARESLATWRETLAGAAENLVELPEPERSLLAYLRRHGETSEHDLLRALRGNKKKLRDACETLHQRGVLARGEARQPPRVRPRTELVVVPLVSPAQLEHTLNELRHAPRQQAVVRWLAEQENGSESTPPIAARALYAATGVDRTMLRQLEHKGMLRTEEREVLRDPLAPTASVPLSPNNAQRESVPLLTAGQRRVWEPIAAALESLRARTEQPEQEGAEQEGAEQESHVFLLHGVTGSGKTEIYLRAAARVLRWGMHALVLVPEIALTTQLVARFAARFPGQVAVLHSGLTPGERYDEWRRARRAEALLIIGSRSAVFAPMARPGLVVVDEEHEASYKQDSRVPRYHARDVALALGQQSGCVVILGSATPSVESYHAAQRGRYRLLELSERVGRMAVGSGKLQAQPLPMPQVRLVDMRRELHEEHRSIFSRPLQQALAAALERGEQAILFLNRRGAATFVMCRDCGHVVACPACGSPLIMHYEHEEEHRGSSKEKLSRLVCHSCNHQELVPPFCTACLSPRIKSFGVGTQRVEQEVQHLFPTARPLRWDRDSTTGKGSHSRLLGQVERHEVDILIGTQMIAKGLDLPRVSMVGVIAADTMLFLPDFRSGERAFQLLTQVAGRAGRRDDGAQVIIQTYNPEYYALRAAQEHDYRSFYLQEIAFRRQTAYPPFGRLVRFLYVNRSQANCRRAAEELASRLREAAANVSPCEWGLVGPAPAFAQRVRGQWRWNLLLKVSGEPGETRAALARVLAALGPLPGWTVDVDPMHVL